MNKILRQQYHFFVLCNCKFFFSYPPASAYEIEDFEIKC